MARGRRPAADARRPACSRGRARGGHRRRSYHPEACGLCETARVAAYLAEQSAGQCGPCEPGFPPSRGPSRRSVTVVTRGHANARARRMRQMEGRGACRHPDGAVATRPQRAATRSPNTSTGTSATARAPGCTGRRCCREHPLRAPRSPGDEGEAAARPDRVRGPRPLCGAVARAGHAGRVGLPDRRSRSRSAAAPRARAPRRRECPTLALALAAVFARAASTRVSTHAQRAKTGS